MPRTSKQKRLGLTYLQIRFCEEYIKDFRTRKAMTRAGYSTKSKTDLFAIPGVKLYVEELMEEAKNDSILTAAQRAELLSGFSTSDEHATRDRIAAIKELNTMFGDHAPTKNALTISGPEKPVEQMTEEEIEAELARLKNSTATAPEATARKKKSGKK
jgi:phage terminase small subunit